MIDDFNAERIKNLSVSELSQLSDIAIKIKEEWDISCYYNYGIPWKK